MIGYHFIQSKGLCWRDNQGGLLPLSPPNMCSSIESKDAQSIINSNGALFLRWESDFDGIADTPWWHIIKEDAVRLADLSSNTRSKVRRGLKAYECESLPRDTILKEGYKVYRSAFSRYETHEREFSEMEFLNAIKALPLNTEFWGVRNKETADLVAFSENYVESDCCFYNTIWFDPTALRKYSSYALFYEMNRHYLEDREFRYISDGTRSLSHRTKIHDFLESKFGFRKAYACLHVVYTPWLGASMAAAFPFRKLVELVPLKPFKKAAILLKQEEIRRQCAKVED